MEEIRVFIYQLFYENRILLALLLIGILLMFRPLIKSNKIALKKRRKIAKHNIIAEYLSGLIDKIEFIRDIRDNLTIDLALITSKNSKTNKIYATNIISIFILVAAILIMLSVILINNIILKLSAPILCIVILPLFLSYIINSKRKKARGEFAEVISSFTSQFALSFNILTALQKSINDIPGVHKYEFARLITAIQSTDDYIKAIDEYALRINTNLCYVFAEILKASIYNNEGTLEGLIELENLITVEKQSQAQRVNKLKKRNSNIVLWFILCVVFTIMDFKLMGSFVSNFYGNTFIGQIVIIIGVVVTLVVFISTYIVNKL
jgi:Flp pilus assembly protein TadB